MNYLQKGYDSLFKEDINSAIMFFSKISSIDTRADWALHLIQFIKKNITSMPTYFQIRNFLEIDINLLIQNGNSQFVENIINSADLLFEVNPESYKFIARVMLANELPQAAQPFLLMGCEKFYSDPELHFMLAKVYLSLNNQQMVEKELSVCLKILPNYYPAINLQKEIANKNRRV